MFVARNVFSISFAISAASALETAWISEQVWRRTFAACLKHSSVTPPTHARGGLLRVGLDARVDALGGERDVDVLARDQAAAGERLDEHPARRADRGGRGEDDRLARAGVRDDRVAGAAQRAQVRLAALVDRGRHGDDHRVGGGELGRVGRQREALGVELPGELGLLVVEQLRVAGGDRGEAALGDVEADDGVAGDAERDRGRQPDVAHADDGDAEVSGRRASVGACQVGGCGNRVHVWCVGGWERVVWVRARQGAAAHSSPGIRGVRAAGVGAPGLGGGSAPAGERGAGDSLR